MNKIPLINQIIKDKRKELKLTQNDFANIINKSPTTVKRYDTGDIIPQNTLLLICEKLNLSYFQLLDQQSEENKKDNTEYYKTHMKNYIKSFSNNELYEHKKMSKQLELLYNFYDDFILDKNISFYSCRYKDNKFYIKDNLEEKIVLVLTPSQAEKIINGAKNYIKFLLFEVSEEKINK